jgi:thiol-disulfide isomerase/thioredoxin
MRLVHLFALCLLLTACSPKAPHSELPTDANGRWLLINYWASWCKPCLEEMPELVEFAQQHADIAAVVAINFDGLEGAALEAEAKKLGVDLPMLTLAASKQLGFEPPNVLPTTLVLSPEREQHQALIGPQTVSSLLRAIKEAQP